MCGRLLRYTVEFLEFLEFSKKFKFTPFFFFFLELNLLLLRSIQQENNKLHEAPAEVLAVELRRRGQLAESGTTTIFIAAATTVKKATTFI